MGTSLRVLILEDRPTDAELILHELRRGGFDPDWQRVDNEADFRACLLPEPEIVLADYSLPQWDAPHALGVLREADLDIPFIMISGTVGEDLAVECIKQGAADYLLKDRLSRLGPAVSRALAEKRARVEKQQAEEKLRRLQEFNEKIIQTAAEGISLQDENGHYIFVNPAGAATLGRLPDDILGQHWTAIFSPDQHAAIQAAYDRHRQGETDRYEAEIVRPDGSRRSLLVSGTPRYEDGRFAGTLAIFTDFTERKLMEGALATERNLLRTLIDNLPDIIFIKNRQGRIIIDNVAHRALLGLASDEILGKTDFDFFSEELASQYTTDDQAVIQSGQPLINREEQTVDAQGARRWLLTSKVPLRNSRGEITGLVGINRDITERKRADEALAHERNLLRTLIDSLPDLVYAKDTESRFILCNQACARHLGVAAPQQVIGTRDYDYYPTEMSAKFAADDERVLRSGQALIGQEEPVVDAGGRSGWLLTTKVPLRDTQGEVIGLVGVGHDISERKRVVEILAAERALLRTLVDSLRDFIYVKDTQGRFILSNLAVARLLGVSLPEETIGKRDSDYLPPELAAKYEADDRHVLESGQALVGYEEAIVDAAGTTRWLLTTKVPLRDDQGIVIGLVGNGHDITERKRAEETLRLSETKFRRFVEQAVEGIILTDEQGIITEWNRSMEHITGLAKDQVVGQALWDIQHQVMPDVARARTTVGDIKGMTLEFLRTGQAPWALNPMEYEMQRADGSRRFVQMTIFPIETAKGYIAASLMQDITERRRAENALREREEILRYVVKHDPNAIAIYDTQLHYIAASDRYLQDYNVREADIIGKHHYEVFPEMPQRWKDVHQRCLLGAIERNDDDSFERPDGSITYNRWECRPWRWIDGRIGGIITYTEVTTERKMAELEIRKLNAELEQRIIERTTELSHIKERVEAILNSSNDIIIMCRMDSTIEQANPALGRACLITPDEVFGQPLASLLVPDDKSVVTDAFQAVITTGTPERLEVAVLRKDGATFEADMILSPVVERGKRLLGVVCSLRDISDRKMMEVQLRHMLKQAMEMSEIRSRYMSMAAHDLGNPLAAIQALVTTIQNYGDKMTEEQKQAKYEDILASAKAATDILGDVLTIGRVEGGQIKFTPAPLDLRSFCLDMVAEVLQATDSSRRIRLSYTGQCAGAYADAKLLRHIVGNLLSNAIKYSPADSEVSFSLECAPDQATIRVQDWGIGIPEADQARLFTAFHRAGNAARTPGTGLGLAIVKQSVELHGGNITFESEQGQGTTFTVTLPTAKAADKN